MTAVTEETVLPSSETQTPLLTPFRFTCCLRAPLNVGTASGSVQSFRTLSADLERVLLAVLHVSVAAGEVGRLGSRKDSSSITHVQSI